jgi:hypothetical protein
LNSGANSRLVLVFQTPFLLNRAYQRCPPMRGTINDDPVAQREVLEPVGLEGRLTRERSPNHVTDECRYQIAKV